MAVIVASSGIISTTTGPRELKKMVNILERKPVFKTSGRVSSSVSHTMLEGLSLMVKKEIQDSSPVTTSENLLGPFGSNSCYHLRQIVTLCSSVGLSTGEGRILHTS